MKLLNCLIFLVTAPFLANAFSQTASPVATDLTPMEQVLKEAGDLQASQPQGVAEKLAPMLGELRQLRQKGALTPPVSKLFQDALILLMRTQSLLLLPEQEVVASLRELLVVNPRIEDGLFNPREKLLLDRLRSSETGRLALQTNPPGCTLTYQTMEMGVTPLEIPLVAGTYHLLLTKQGYYDQDFEITVRSSEILNMTRPMRRRTVELPLSVNVAGTSVSLNGQVVGATQPLTAWLASLPAEKQQEMGSLVREWNLDPNNASFFRLSEIPPGEALKLEFRAPCYETLGLNLTISEADVNWNRPVVVRPELRRIELKRDVGFVEISSTPSGAEVWLDGSMLGKTPVGRDVCVGNHRVQVLHRSGQYVSEVNVRRGQAAKIGGELKPAIAFLGVYSQGSQNSVLSLLARESEAVARRLALRTTAFSNPQIPVDDIESNRKKGNLPLERLLDPKLSPGDAEMLVSRIATEAGRSDMILVGLSSGDKYLFRLHSTIQPIPDLIDTPNLDDASLDFLIAQLNKAERIASRLQMAVTGLDLIDSPKGLVVLKVDQMSAAVKSPLVPGSIIRSVDQKPMNFRDLRNYLSTRQPGQPLSLEVYSGKDPAAAVALTLRSSGTEYPWNTPDGFSNSVLTQLRHLIERDPLADQAKFASLSLARGLMQLGEWKLALEFLAKTNLEPHKSGICPGTVLYYQGYCYEELADRALAESYYARAKDYPDATLGRPDGLSISALAERRIQSLKKAGR